MQINLTPDLSVLAIAAIFIANYFVVRRFFITPINDVLTWRENEIAGAERVYEESLGRFQAATSDMESRIQQAKREGAAHRESLRNEALTYRESLVNRVRGEAQQITGGAREQLARDTAGAREQIVRDSEALARLAAEKLLGRKL